MDIKSGSAKLWVNGAARAWQGAPDRMLLHVLRDDFGLTGTKSACERGECGACTVLVGGTAMLSCMLPAVLVDAAVETIEGLADEALPLREAFADHGAFQCGFCTSGQIVQALATIRAGDADATPGAEERVRHAMSGNICRCTGYVGIVDAVLAAAAAMKGDAA